MWCPYRWHPCLVVPGQATRVRCTLGGELGRIRQAGGHSIPREEQATLHPDPEENWKSTVSLPYFSTPLQPSLWTYHLATRMIDST